MFINRVTLYGNLTKDIELRTTQGGTSVASFTVATNRKWRGQDGTTQEDSQFHNVVAWGKTAELMKQYLSKGSAVYIEGRLQTRSYDDKNGVKRYVTEVVVESMQFGPKSSPRPQNESVPTIQEDEPIEARPTINPDDLPF